MASQFVLMPTFAYFLGWAFLQTNFERLGLLILGCSPGGANSNFWVSTRFVEFKWTYFEL